jgi:SAM-dependent methyltransferase
MGAGFSHQDGQALLKSMDITISQKVAVCAAHMMLAPGASVLDAGCANGSATAYFALKNPDVHVIGVDYDADYIKQARAQYGDIPNLEFIEADLTKLDLGDRKLDAIVNLSILHEPFSYSGYRAKTVEEIIAAELKNLKDGGIIINRDFMLPDEPDAQVYIALSTIGADEGDDYEALSDASFFEAYAEEAMSYDNGDAAHHIKGFFYEDVTADVAAQIGAGEDKRVFAVAHQFAWEFTWRNQYRKRFENEAEEKYAFWTHKQHSDIPKSLGARVVYSAPYENPWIMQNWYQPHIGLYDENFKPLPLPPSNFISVLQKKEGAMAAIEYREHVISKTAPSYLNLKSFKNRENGHVFDMVARPGEDVIDVLPFGYDEQGDLVIVAKDGYPRPLANIRPRKSAPRIDGKIWSGHMIEPIAAANIEGDEHKALKTLLSERVGIKADSINFEHVIEQYYYPAVSELNERVHALCVELHDLPAAPLPLADGFSGFEAQGVARCFNAQSLLQAAQAGMLPEARLENNIYTLMRREGVTPKNWFGQELSLSVARDIEATPLAELLKQERDFAVYEETAERSNWLEVVRSEFHEVAHENGRDKLIARKELEFVMPAENYSINMAMGAVLVQDDDGEVLLAVRKLTGRQSQYPGVQQREGHSGLLTLPGVRLPQEVKHIQDVPQQLAKVWDIDEGDARGLGEGYFPSLGVMPYRVFPFAVTQVSSALKQSCDFVSLREVFQNADKIHDLHLLNTIYRAVHALGLWENYNSEAKEHKDFKVRTNQPKM